MGCPPFSLSLSLSLSLSAVSDNQPVLDFIEKRPHGVLVLLDDEIRMPGGSDRSFVEKVHKAHARTPCLVNVRMR